MKKMRATVMIDGQPVEYVEPYITRTIDCNGILTLKGSDVIGHWMWTRVFPPDVWSSLTIERFNDE